MQMPNKNVNISRRRGGTAVGQSFSVENLLRKVDKNKR